MKHAFESFRIKKSLSVTAMLLASLLLSYCAVNVKSLTPDETVAFKNDILDPYRLSIESTGQEIDLFQTMALALRYNLQNRIDALETSMTQLESNSFKKANLPNIVANAGYTITQPRDINATNANGTSTTLRTEDQRQFNGGIQSSWNFLDFGLGFARAQQAGNRALARRELHHIAMTRLIADVQQAWWSGVTAQYYLPEIQLLEQDIEIILRQREELQNDNITPSLQTLQTEHDLIESSRQLTRLRNQLLLDEFRLIELTGLDPTKRHRFKREVLRLPVIDYSIDDLDEASFRLSPVIRLALYENRSNIAKLRAQTTQNLVSFGPNLELNVSSDSHFSSSQWFNYGIGTSWNLIELFKTPSRGRKKATGKKLAEARLLAVGMSVLIRNRIALQRYHQSLEELSASLWLNFKSREIELRTVNAIQGHSALITDALSARASQVISALESSAAFGQVYYDAFDLLNGSGLIYVPPIDDNIPIDKSARLLRQRFGAVAGVQYIPLDSESAQILQQERVARKTLSQIFEMWKRSRALDQGDPIFYSGPARALGGSRPDLGLGSVGLIPDRPSVDVLSDAVTGVPEAPLGSSRGDGDLRILEQRDRARREQGRITDRPIGPSVTLPPSVIPSEGAAPQDGAPQGALPQDAAPQDGAPQGALPQDAAPQDGAPQGALPQDAAPQDGAPQGALPQDTAPQDGAPQGALPQNAAPQGATPPTLADQLSRRISPDSITDPSNPSTNGLPAEIGEQGPRALFPIAPEVPRNAESSLLSDEKFIKELQDFGTPLSQEALERWRALQKRGRPEQPLPPTGF